MEQDATTQATHEWHYEENGERRGPVAESAIAQLIKDGKLTYGNMVWRKGIQGWIKLEDSDLKIHLNDDQPPPLPGDMVNKKMSEEVKIDAVPENSEVKKDEANPFGCLDLGGLVLSFFIMASNPLLGTIMLIFVMGPIIYFKWRKHQAARDKVFAEELAKQMAKQMEKDKPKEQVNPISKGTAEEGNKNEG